MVAMQSVVDPFGMWPRATRAGRHAAVAAGDAAGRLAMAGLERALASPRAEEAVDLVVARLLATRLPEHVADHLLAGGVAERVIDRVLAGPDLQRLVATVLESPQVTVLAAEVLESEVVERVVDQVIDEVAESPAVTEAISRQSVGLADQVAGEVGRRSRSADAKLERAARRLLRRSVPPEGAGPLPAPGAP